MTINKATDRMESNSSLQDAGRLYRDVSDSSVGKEVGSPRSSIISETSLPSDEFHVCLGKKQLDENLNLSMDSIFTLLFTDCSLYKMYCQQINVSNVVSTEWVDDVEKAGNTVRSLTYNVLIKSPIGNRTAGMMERQVCSRRDDVAIVVDCFVQNPNIPYGNNFVVCNHYRISRMSAQQIHITIFTEIQYKKTVWGLVKSIIEKTVTQGAAENFTALEALLKRECGLNTTSSSQLLVGKPAEEPAVGSQDSKVRKRSTTVRRRRPNTLEWQNRSTVSSDKTYMGPPSITPGSDSTGSHVSTYDTRSHAGHSTREEDLSQSSSHLVVMVICFTLLMLLVGNAILFYKLWQLEDFNLKTQIDRRSVDSGAMPVPVDRHREVVERWQLIIGKSLQLVDELKNSLVHLQTEGARELDRLARQD